jgi:tRNA pseudouridine55 synthase
MSSSETFDFQKGEILLVDKPLHWTSFDVVNKLRWHIKRKLGVKNIKVGHAGTLDPLATGLLIICTGKNTKLIEQLMATRKTYTGTVLLGKSTPSYDLETEYNAELPVEHIALEEIEQIRKTFLGEQDQIPPLFSAKKVDGKRAYDAARAGKEMELKPNRITIYSLELDTSRFPEIDFVITCSKGTYIRSFAHDLGQKLGTLGTLIALRRVASGDQQVDQARSVEEWIAKIDSLELGK